MPSELIDSLTALATRAAIAAGEELVRRYGNVEGLNTKSTATDPVSDADRASERLLVDLLLAERPDDGMIGEEGAARDSASGLTWVIDPLDGTVNYLYQLDNFSVSVAVEDADGSLVGVVHDPITLRTYTGIRGHGAYLDAPVIGGEPGETRRRRLKVNDPVPLGEAMVGTGFGYSPERRAAQGALVAALLPQIRDIRRIGSAALDLCAVGAGLVDAFFEEGLQRWDMAAGGLIASEAGAVVVPFTPTGAPTGMLAAGPALFGPLTEAVAAITGAGR